MKNHTYAISGLIAISQLFCSCSGESDNEKQNKKADTIALTELKMDIDNSDWVIISTDSALQEIDFTNFSYLPEEGTSVTVTNGESYMNDSTGYDSVYISNESYRTHINDDDTKLIELTRHYGYGSSNSMNYIFAFQKIENKLILTGSLKYVPLKRAGFDSPVIFLFAEAVDPAKYTDSQPIKSYVQIRKGNFEVIKSETDNKK